MDLSLTSRSPICFILTTGNRMGKRHSTKRQCYHGQTPWIFSERDRHDDNWVKNVTEWFGKHFVSSPVTNVWPEFSKFLESQFAKVNCEQAGSFLNLVWCCTRLYFTNAQLRQHCHCFHLNIRGFRWNVSVYTDTCGQWSFSLVKLLVWGQGRPHIPWCGSSTTQLRLKYPACVMQ